MGVPLFPVFDRYAQITGGIETITNQSVVNQYGINSVGIITGFIFAEIWQYCHSDPSTTWTSCYSAPSTGWSACYSQPVTSWSLVTFGM